MDIQTFDKKFQELYTALVEIAFEFAGRNAAEVDDIFVYGSIEVGYFYNVFYRINGQYVKLSKVNSVSVMQYDVSSNRMFDLLGEGADLLLEVAGLFKDAGREVPTIMKMQYSPKTGKFDNQIGYELQYSDHEEKTAAMAFEQWVSEIQTGIF